LDLVDEGFDGGLALGDAAAVHDLGQVLADAGDGAGWRRCGPAIEFSGELRVSGL
jgi:hypothetical protein